MNFGGTTSESGVGACIPMELPPASSPVRQDASALQRAASDGRVAAALGNNADLVPTPARQLPAPGTVTNWHLRSLGREILKKHGVERRMRWCGSRISGRADGVGVYSRPDRAYGRVSGVCVCGQSICCPVCAPRIAAFRSGEIAEAFKRGLDAGFQVNLETFTKPHRLSHRPDALSREVREFAGIWRRFQHHADRREKQSLLGFHLGREITWGAHGWHYHHHRLRYDRPWSFQPGLVQAGWNAALESVGLRSDASDEYGYKFGVCDTEAGARYVAKLATSVDAQARCVGSELASGVTKGRSINSLLLDYHKGDLQAAAIWLNGVCCVTAGKISSVRWSRGWRARIGMDAEKSDQAIAEDEQLPTDRFLGALNPWQWQGILKWNAEFALCFSAQQGEAAVNDFLAGLELGRLNDDDPRAVWRNDKGNSENVGL